jgi:hypothetical protein
LEVGVTNDYFPVHAAGPADGVPMLMLHGFPYDPHS